MSEAQQRLSQMEQAEERGDHQRARALARAILTSGERPISGDPELAGAETSDRPEEAAAQASARALLARTEPDPFLLVVGILGLGLMVWLVYNYVL